VVARGMGKCCVAGVDGIRVVESEKRFYVGDEAFTEGDAISLDGARGVVLRGEVPTLEPELTGEFREIMIWATHARRLGLRANADTPDDARLARELGAEGIGLCRTEHMFFGEERLPHVQAMILAEDEESRAPSLRKLEEMQKEDFKGILREMQGLPVIIRLLDPPLHEFLPNHEELMVEITQMRLQQAAEKDIKEKEDLLERVSSLQEMNPMLGHRGCRLGITFPDVYRMQARAVSEAAAELTSEGVRVIPEIMIPLVVDKQELVILKPELEEVIARVKAEAGVDFPVKIGTMIELPRAALCANEIGEVAEFFSFGTNDLTQTTFGFSRDDAEGKFLHAYLDRKVLKQDPFQVLDQSGVGQLVELATARGREVNADLEVGICGEHGGEPSSVKFCHRVGLDYVSCSPYRVPIACLAAAQAALEDSE